MSAEPLIKLCQRIRPELACLGDLGLPLLDVMTVIERIAGDADVAMLSEPAFALDVLAATAGNADPAVIGRVLDFLRQRIGAAPARIVASASPVPSLNAPRSSEAAADELVADFLVSTGRHPSVVRHVAETSGQSATVINLVEERLRRVGHPVFGGVDRRSERGLALIDEWAGEPASSPQPAPAQQLSTDPPDPAA